MKIGKSHLTWTWGDIVIPFVKFKSIEYQFEFGRKSVALSALTLLHPGRFEFAHRKDQDHPGFYFEVGLWMIFWMGVSLYDHRHLDQINSSK